MTEFDQTIMDVASQNQVDPIALLAVKKVEFADYPAFLEDGSPSIQFEGHIFYELYNKKHPKTNPINFEKKHPGIYYPYWLKKYYLKGLEEYDRLNKAIDLDKEVAPLSTSWGFAKLLGLDHKLCGCDTIKEFIFKVGKDEESQVQLWINYLKNKGLLELMEAHNWADLAIKYNGTHQAKYYTTLFQVYYEKYSK